MPVTRFEITLRRPLADGAAFGDTGAYEELKGRLHFTIDPLHPSNARITDVELAPRDQAGRVTFSSEVSLLVPLDRTRCRGGVLLDVVNRGNTIAVPNFNRATRPVFGPDSDPNPPIDTGDGFLMRRGFVVLSCGWQGDLPDLPGLLRLHGPDAVHPDGRPITGRVYTQLQSHVPTACMLLSDRGHRPYPAADLDERDAQLTVQDQPDAEPVPIPRERWRFAKVTGGQGWWGGPGEERQHALPPGSGERVVPDAGHITLDGGFEKGRLYRIAYTALGAPVMGLGPAALREAASWIKHGTAAEGNPAPGRLRHVYGYGRSQTGRLLRTYVYYDLNLDEQGREGLDGIIANVPGGLRGEFNQRFGQNSKDRPQMMAHLFPFTDVTQGDPETGHSDALHRRIDARRSRLKIMYTNTSAEYHRGDASLIHTDPDGGRDVAHGSNTRIYLYAGTEHSLGAWPPTDRQIAAADPTGAVDHSQNLRGVVDYSRLLRACLVNLDRWVAEGVEPPPSVHPRVTDGSAAAAEELAKVFDAIPEAHYPRHHPRPLRLDFGAQGELRETPTIPPRRGHAYGSRVSAVDADGNEVGGIAVPELAVPLATHTGWNPRHPEIGGPEQLLVFVGSTLFFPRTREEREATGDPRISIEERYRSRENYLEQVRQAGRELSARGYLLDEDIELSVTLAARMWDYRRAGAADGPRSKSHP
jgi:hypothetical protein